MFKEIIIDKTGILLIIIRIRVHIINKEPFLLKKNSRNEDKL